MPTSTIKSDLSPATCPACGEPITMDANAPGRIKRYCDDKCRVAYHRGKRPASEPTLQNCLILIDEMSEGFLTFKKEIEHIKKVLRKHYSKK